MCEVLDRIEKKGIAQGEDRILTLMKYLLTNDRMDDAKRATEDEEYRGKLLSEIFTKKQQ